MSRNPSRFTPRCDALEPRLALAAGAAAAADAILTPAEYVAARRGIERSLLITARTGDEARAEAALARGIGHVPGGDAVLSQLEADLATFTPGVRYSALEARHRMATSLDAFIRDGVDAGTIEVRGALRSRFRGPAVTTPVGGGASLASYRFTAQNQTNQALTFLVTQGGVTLSNTTVFAQRQSPVNYTPQGQGSVTLNLTGPNSQFPLYNGPLGTGVYQIQVTPSGQVFIYG